MSVYKDGSKWRVIYRYTDSHGERKQTQKRGFSTKKEAQEYETEFLAKKKRDINMGFSTFIDVYMGDIKPRIKPTTYATKENIINTHIRPYFENKSLSGISSVDILQWQNELLMLRDTDRKGYSQTYLRTVQNQLNAIFNHAVRYYDLPKSPCAATKKMGKSKSKEMLFWTKEEYLKFAVTIQSPLQIS